MNNSIVSAIFASPVQAEQAVSELRREGFSDTSISVVRRSDDNAFRDGDGEIVEADDKFSGAVKGIGIGAGAGALFGLSALLIPGAGPFIAAGTLIETFGVLGSAAATGAVVGGTAGGLSGALMNYGLSKDDADFYEGRIREGGIWIAVDTRNASGDAGVAARILHRAGGTATTRSVSELVES